MSVWLSMVRFQQLYVMREFRQKMRLKGVKYLLDPSYRLIITWRMNSHSQVLATLEYLLPVEMSPYQRQCHQPIDQTRVQKPAGSPCLSWLTTPIKTHLILKIVTGLLQPPYWRKQQQTSHACTKIDRKGHWCFGGCFICFRLFLIKSMTRYSQPCP